MSLCLEHYGYHSWESRDELRVGRQACWWLNGRRIGWENLSLSQTRWLIWSRQGPVALTTLTSLVTCDILPAIRIVIGQRVACILSSSPEQILLAMYGRWFRGLSPTVSILDEEEKSEQQTPSCHLETALIRYRIEKRFLSLQLPLIVHMVY